MFGWFKKKKKKEKKDPWVNTTRIVKTKSGSKVELYNDQPDAMADLITECFESGKAVFGEIKKDGTVTREYSDSSDSGSGSDSGGGD